MKKLLILTAAFMTLQSLPVLADNHGDHKGDKPKHEREIKGDTNGDGVISQEEFMTRAQERFTKMDANGDGTIEREEAKAAHDAKRKEMREKRKERREKRED